MVCQTVGGERATDTGAKRATALAGDVWRLAMAAPTARARDSKVVDERAIKPPSRKGKSKGA